MNITPETPEEIEAVRQRATGITNGPFEEALFEACKEWVEANPPKPGPGSVLRYESGYNKPLRIVKYDGTLMDLHGNRRHDDSWRLDSHYTLVCEVEA